MVAEMLANGSAVRQVVTLVAEQLSEMLFLVGCRFDASTDETDLPLLDRDGELHHGRTDWSVGSQGLPDRDVILPVESQGRRLGAYILRGSIPPFRSPKTAGLPPWPCRTWSAPPSTARPAHVGRTDSRLRSTSDRCWRSGQTDRGPTRVAAAARTARIRAERREVWSAR